MSPRRDTWATDKSVVVGGTSGLQTKNCRRPCLPKFRGDTGLGTGPRGLGGVGYHTQSGERPAGLGHLGSGVAALGYGLESDTRLGRNSTC